MKTRELIRQLQEADPSGEEECAVGNTDIHYVDVESAYWDGCLQVLKRNEKEECYNITGGEFRGSGKKVVINTLSIKGAIWNTDGDFPITYDGEFAEEEYAPSVAEWRNEVKAFLEKNPRARVIKE